MIRIKALISKIGADINVFARIEGVKEIRKIIRDDKADTLRHAILAETIRFIVFAGAGIILFLLTGFSINDPFVWMLIAFMFALGFNRILFNMNRSSLINTPDGAAASIFPGNTQPLNLMGYL